MSSKKLTTLASMGDKIKYARLKLGLNQFEFATKLGFLSATVISRYESNLRKPDMDTLAHIANMARLSLDWLITGREPMELPEGENYSTHGYMPTSREEEPIGAKAEMVREINSDFGDYVFIAQVNGKISADEERVPENAVEIKVAFRKDWIRRKGDPKNMVLIRVAGDSMEPTLLNSDLVLIDRGRNYIEPQGGIYAIALDNIIMIKRIQVLEDKLRIISDNTRYEPLEVTADRIKVNGKVIWFARELER
jgi:phage repressor protein C with HTH and peptisase S24 domain